MMRIIPILIALIILSGCAYTGEVVTIDTITEQQEEPAAPATPEEMPAADEREDAPEITHEESPAEEEPAVQPETVYEGIVVVKTGLSRYRIRLPNGQDTIITTREDLRPEMVIRFTLDKNNVVTSLVIVQ